MAASSRRRQQGRLDPHLADHERDLPRGPVPRRQGLLRSQHPRGALRPLVPRRHHARRRLQERASGGDLLTSTPSTTRWSGMHDRRVRACVIQRRSWDGSTSNVPAGGGRPGVAAHPAGGRLERALLARRRLPRGRRRSRVLGLRPVHHAGETGYPLLAEGHGLDFSPDGRYPRRRRWRWARLTSSPRTSSAPPYALYDVLQGHTEDVVGAVAWSPDGSTPASVAGGPLLGDAAFNDSVQGDDDHRPAVGARRGPRRSPVRGAPPRRRPPRRCLEHHDPQRHRRPPRHDVTLHVHHHDPHVVHHLTTIPVGRPRSRYPGFGYAHRPVATGIRPSR